MTPFEEAGYTKDTKFKVLRDRHYLKVGDIVTLCIDFRDNSPLFKTEDGRRCFMWLPGMTPKDWDEQLKVDEEPSEGLTPFEEAGYTEDTKFKVLRNYGRLKRGDIVTLDEDYGSGCPRFKTEDGRKKYMYLPNMIPEGCKEDIEVYEEPKEFLKKEMNNETKTTSNKYEHLIERINDSLITDCDLKSMLDSLGDQGWELCNSSGSKFIFKRLIK